MSRMHSKGKGRSGSTRPNVSEPAEWSLTDQKELVELIMTLNERGNSTAAIGTILRDQHGVPSVRLALGKKIGAVLAENGKRPNVPEDLMNLMLKAMNLLNHLESNPKDLHNGRQLELTESKIRRTARYHIGKGNLPDEWRYKRDQLRLMVE